MSKFIELTRESGDKVFVNVDRINTIQPVDDDRAFVFMTEEDCFDVTESYEQVKHLIETGEPFLPLAVEAEIL